MEKHNKYSNKRSVMAKHSQYIITKHRGAQRSIILADKGVQSAFFTVDS